MIANINKNTMGVFAVSGIPCYRTNSGASGAYRNMRTYSIQCVE